MKKLLILGARSLAVEVADIAADTGAFEVAGFVENIERDRCADSLEGLPIYWVDDLPKFAATHVAVCAFGTVHRRLFIEHAVQHGIQFATVIHPSARVSRNSSVGEGSVLNAGVIVATHSSIGRHVIVNRGALIGHHTTIGDFSSIMPGANIAGACTIGASSFVGMGAIVVDHTFVGELSIVAAGSVVTKNVPARAQVVGVPAKVVRENTDGR